MPGFNSGILTHSHRNYFDIGETDKEGHAPVYLRGFRELKSRLDAERPKNSQHEIRRDVMGVPIENCRHASP